MALRLPIKIQIPNKYSPKVSSGKPYRQLLKASKKGTGLKAASTTIELEENVLVEIDCSLDEFFARISNDHLFEESLKLIVS